MTMVKLRVTGETCARSTVKDKNVKHNRNVLVTHWKRLRRIKISADKDFDHNPIACALKIRTIV